MESCCYLRNIQDLLSDGKTPHERRFGMPFGGPVILFGAMVEYHPISARDTMVADIEELEEMDASELHARRLNAKEVLTPQRSGNVIFPVADGTVKIFGREERLRTSTSTRDRPERGEEQEILQGKSDEFHSPTLLQDDSTRDDEEAKNDFWTITGEFILSSSRGTQSQTVRAERRIISYSVEVHRRYQNNIFITRRNVGENIGDYRNVDGEKELSELYKIHFLNERPPD